MEYIYVSMNGPFDYAFEYCGIYYHSEIFKGKNYHYEKMKKCLEKNIKLITIFEDEWIHNPEKVKNRIRAVLGFNLEKKYARNLKIDFVDMQEASFFYEKYHLQGKPHSFLISFGLYENQELLGLVTLGRHHRINSDKRQVL